MWLKGSPAVFWCGNEQLKGLGVGGAGIGYIWTLNVCNGGRLIVFAGG